MFALNCTELPGAAIDACGAGISLRGISVAAGMTEVKPIMHSALTVEKSAYNGSSRMAEIVEEKSEWTVKFAGSHSCAGLGESRGKK